MIHVIKNSLIDYPGKTSAVIGLPGCNLRCPYCQNPELALAEPDFRMNEWHGFKNLLVERKGFIDGVVISGGEPTIHKGLDTMCEVIKSLGYSIKIDTNGTRPDVLKDLIDKKLIDYVAVSVRPLGRWDIFAESLDMVSNTWKTLELLKASNISYEVRIVAVAETGGFENWLKGCAENLHFFGITKKLKLHRHNKSAKILQPEFYEGVKMYGESDYLRLSEIVRSQGLECEVV